jgi:hypothetical protein
MALENTQKVVSETAQAMEVVSETTEDMASETTEDMAAEAV